MNQVNLIGNLTKDVELRYTTNQNAIARFTLAVNDRRKNPQTGEWEDNPSLIPVVVFGKQAENAERFLSKGSKAGVTGRIQTGSYEKDGQRIYTTDVIATNVEYLNSRPQPAAQSGYMQTAPNGFTALQEDDVPWVG